MKLIKLKKSCLLFYSVVYILRGRGQKYLFFFSRVSFRGGEVEREEVLCFNSLLRCVDFFFIKRHRKMTRLTLPGQILTLRKTAQHDKFIL